VARVKALVFASFFLSACYLFSNQYRVSSKTDPQEAAEGVITDSMLRDYVNFLADPNMTAGRGTGQIGYEITRDFLAGELREMGYEVALQKFFVREILFPSGRRDTAYSWNIIGFLQGGNIDSGTVMFSAHADHDGVHGNVVFPGADDNASGVAVVLGIARAFGLLKIQGVILRRSIVICFWGAEETPRMEGSYHFVRSEYARALRPIVLLNFDMVGRGGFDTLAVLGAKNNKNFSAESPTLYRLVGESNVDHLVIINTDPTAPEKVVNRFVGSFQRTDSWNFYLHEIPVLFFFAGFHADYHRPTDTAEKLDYEKMARIARLAFRIGFRLAANNVWPVVLRDSVYIDLR